MAHVHCWVFLCVLCSFPSFSFSFALCCVVFISFYKGVFFSILSFILETLLYVAGLNVLAGVGLLSTPYAVKEAGWASLAVLLIFAVVCCYTAYLMSYCFESREGVLTFPDMGEAAYGKYGRVFVSVS